MTYPYQCQTCAESIATTIPIDNLPGLIPHPDGGFMHYVRDTLDVCGPMKRVEVIELSERWLLACPACPVCGHPPAFVLAGAVQAFCTNDDCEIVLWNPSETQAVNLEDLSWSVVDAASVLGEYVDGDEEAES